MSSLCTRVRAGAAATSPSRRPECAQKLCASTSGQGSCSPLRMVGCILTQRRYASSGCVVLAALLLACGGEASGESGAAGVPASGECAAGAGGERAGNGTTCADFEAAPVAVCGTAPEPLAPPPCPSGDFYYTDRACGPTPGGALSCGSDEGDLRCHKLCATDAECADPCRPHCHTLGLFSGGDYQCNGHVRVCGTSTSDECF
jgi:hypothetical protein